MREMLGRIDSRELSEWIAFLNVEANPKTDADKLTEALGPLITMKKET